MADGKHGRLPGPPRLPDAKRPSIPKQGSIPDDPESMPDSIDYDASKKRLRIGGGYIENVEPEVWNYEVSGKRVLPQWFSYRKADRERPIMGDRRKPSPLCDMQPAGWLPEYTTELINVLNVLGLLVELEPLQAAMLNNICGGPLITTKELLEAKSFEGEAKTRSSKKDTGTASLFGE